jgi:hypothetical protein
MRYFLEINLPRNALLHFISNQNFINYSLQIELERTPDDIRIEEISHNVLCLEKLTKKVRKQYHVSCAAITLH